MPSTSGGQSGGSSSEVKLGAVSGVWAAAGEVSVVEVLVIVAATAAGRLGSRGLKVCDWGVEAGVGWVVEMDWEASFCWRLKRRRSRRELQERHLRIDVSYPSTQFSHPVRTYGFPSLSNTALPPPPCFGAPVPVDPGAGEGGWIFCSS